MEKDKEIRLSTIITKDLRNAVNYVIEYQNRVYLIFIVIAFYVKLWYTRLVSEFLFTNNPIQN